MSDPTNTQGAVTEATEKAKIVAKAINEVMQIPKSICYEKTYSVILLLSKKRYGGLLYNDAHKWGEEPPTEIKGMQCVRRDGCGLVRDLVRDCIMSVLNSGDIIDAAEIVRKKLLDIMQDKVPLQQYAIQKFLRKTIQDCSLPMSQKELIEIRQQLSSSFRGSKKEEEQLSYEEQDKAILKKIRLPWRTRIKLPHVMLAYKLRLLDVGSSPVLGEAIQYVVLSNGGKQISEKVESLDRVSKNAALVVDRSYYMKSLEIPMQNIFAPVTLQRLLVSLKKDKANAEDEAKAKKIAKDLLWQCIAGMAMSQDRAKRKASIEASPIAQLFRKQKPS